ncbi:hypothetical protein QE250_04250 [Chromatiaceae bacterium AAb-1]|nr:hypothetical protein [Chromatiaceae bacterium AAb-1]
MKRHMPYYLLCCWLMFSITAAEMPDLLVQVSEQKYREPEQMLALLQQHQADFAGLTTEQQVFWLNEKSALLSMLGRHQEQQQTAEQGLSLLAEQPGTLRVELLYQLGFATEMQAAYREAMTLYQQGSALAEQLGDEKLILQGYINQAAIFSMQEQSAQAMALLKEAYERAEMLQDSEVLAEVNAELGLLYASLEYEQDAIPLLENAQQLYLQLGWHKNRITVLYNLARTYSLLEQHDSALPVYHQILQYSQQAQDIPNLYHAYLGLAITSSETGREESALSYIEKAEDYLPQLQSASSAIAHYYEKALIYQRLQQSAQAMQQVLLAEQYLQPEDIDDGNNTRLALQYLKARLQAEQGQYEKAYRQLLVFVEAFQQSRNRENEQALEQLKLHFDHERQQARSSLLEKENELNTLRIQEVERKRQIQLLWLSILGCSTLVLLILLLWQLTRRQQRTIT